MITPLPRPACGCAPWSPKKNRNQGSLACGWRSGALLVLMLTTAAEAFCAACRKLPAGGGPDTVAAGASTSATPRLDSRAGPAQPLGLERGDHEIGRQQHGDGLGKNQPVAAHDVPGEPESCFRKCRPARAGTQGPAPGGLARPAPTSPVARISPAVGPWLGGQSEFSAQLLPRMASAQQLLQAFDGLLQPERFKDYGPNGLQVEGKDEVRRIVSGVTASRALIEAAVAGAGRRDLRAPRAVLARPGRPGHRLDEAAAGPAARARHQPVRLPLAAGRPSRAGQQRPARAASWACRRARASASRTSGFSGSAPTAAASPARRSWPRMWRRRWAGRVAWVEGAQRRDPAASPGAPAVPRAISKSAIAAGADAFITGEISEPQAHYARECGVAFLACGHHASERYGAPAVAGARRGSSWASSTSSSTSTTRHEAARADGHHHGRCGRASGRRSSPRPSGMRRDVTRGCFVAGDLATHAARRAGHPRPARRGAARWR